MFGYSEKKLAKDIQKHVSSIDPSLEFKYSADTSEVCLFKKDEAGNKPSKIYLGNLFTKVKDMSKQERSETIQNFLDHVLTEEEMTQDELFNVLALRVRTDFELHFRGYQIEKKNSDSPFFTYVKKGGLSLELVADGEEAIRSVSGEQLASLDVSTEEAFKVAKATLARITNLEQWQQLENDIWISTYEDDYDFARIVAAGANVRLPFEGSQPIFFAPSHSVCIVTNNTSAQTLKRIVEIGEELAENHRPLDCRFWTTHNESSWDVWMPREDEDGYKEALLQNVKELSSQYSEQMDLLQEKAGDDIYVAKYNTYMDDSMPKSYSVFTLDLPTYLPVTDYVALFDDSQDEEGQILGKVKWDEFITCMNLEDKILESEYPQRYAALEIPTEEQMANLSAKLVPF